MCGIAGVVTRGPSPDRILLERMAGTLAHRGPEDAGKHIAGRVGLAHTRLSIIDLEGGHQPMLDAAGERCLVANCEIYNYLELREELGARGYRFKTHSDSETILAAYAILGRPFLESLRGMFAFALHDPHEESVILARDRLGIKPLYYTVLSDRVLFASELKTLLPELPGPPEIDAEALMQFLQYQFSTGEATPIKGVKRLLPGTALAIGPDLAVRQWRYWNLLDVQQRRVTFAAAREEFDELFAASLREHMRADVPQGLFLSGGIDSGVLCAMLSRLGAGRLRTFSVGYAGEEEAGELAAASATARHYDTEHTVLVVEREQSLARLPHVVWASDDLMRDYACLPTSALAEAAAAELKVVFTGEGGDEVFAGYSRYRKTRLNAWWHDFRHPGSGGFRTRGQWAFRGCRKAVGAQLDQAWSSARSGFIGAWQATPRAWSDVQRRQYTDTVTALPDNLLTKTDRMLMGFSVEGRVPYLDHRIVEFGLSLPDELKVASGFGKVFMRRWAADLLPPDRAGARKRAFDVPTPKWLHGPLARPFAGKLRNNAAIAQWFDRAGLEQMFAAHDAGHDASAEIVSLVQFAIWHRLFVERTGEIPTVQENPLDWI